MSNDKTRRRIIKTAGGVIAIGSMAGVGSAQGGPPDHANDDGKDNGGPPADAKNTCPDDAALLAKYVVEGGEFVFEKDGDYLEAGDAFEFTVTETNEDGEILAFEIEDPEGVYDIYQLSVKTGDGIFPKGIEGTSGEFDVREFDDSPPVQAISNVIVCARVWWQVDFGRGEVPQPPSYDFDDLPYAATGNGTEASIDNPSVNRDDFSKFDYVNVIEPPGLDIDLDEGTATIEFDQNTADKMHLASFEVPGEFGLGELSKQKTFDVVYTSDTAGTLTVDIPTPEAYGND